MMPQCQEYLGHFKTRDGSNISTSLGTDIIGLRHDRDAWAYEGAIWPQRVFVITILVTSAIRKITFNNRFPCLLLGAFYYA